MGPPSTTILHPLVFTFLYVSNPILVGYQTDLKFVLH